MWDVEGRRGIHTGFGGRKMKENSNLDDLGVNAKLILKWNLKTRF